MSSIISDKEINKKFNSSVYEDYTTVLEFITVNPDHSLFKFGKFKIG